MHITVLLDKAVDCLITKKSGIYIDGTFGRGGHSRKILDSIDNNAKLMAIDKDQEAILHAQNQFKDTRFKIFNSSFADIKDILRQENLPNNSITGILLDLGISSPQIDEASRGFSFMRNGELDMRMDTSNGKPLRELIPLLSYEELSDIIFKYGEEKQSRKIARAIKDYAYPINDTLTLASIIARIIPKKSAQHPATKTFQALRIYINKELEDLENILDLIPSLLAPNGKIVIISFHSLEDRIVKQKFNAWANPNKIDDSMPTHLQILQKTLQVEKPALFNLQGKYKPSQQEILDNPRARSAIMRVAVKN